MKKKTFFTSALYATTSNNRAVIHTTLLALISLKQTFSNIESETVIFQPLTDPFCQMAKFNLNLFCN
jgi:hypothetical protein